MLLKVRAGKSALVAAREMACAPSTAYRIVARFRFAGEVNQFDGRGGDGYRKVGPELISGIATVLQGTPQDHGYLRTRWTLELLPMVISEELAVTSSPGHPWKVLKQLRHVRNPKLGPDWMLPGTQRLVVTPGKNQKHYLAGAYDPHRQ